MRKKILTILLLAGMFTMNTACDQQTLTTINTGSSQRASGNEESPPIKDVAIKLFVSLLNT